MTNGKRFRVGIIGAGYVSAYHLRALKAISDIDVVGIVDPDLQRAQSVADQNDVPGAFATLAELESTRPDVVHILTPPALHAPLALDAFARGWHVFVEKPMAESAEDCDRMIEAARQAGLQLSVNHSARMDPVVLEAKRRIASGAIGQVVAVNFLRNSEYIPYAGGATVPPPFGKGSYPFQDLGIHAAYLVETFLGPAEKLEATYWGTGRDAYLQFDEWRAQLHCRDGVGQISLSWNSQPMLNEILIQGTKGMLHLDCYLQMVSSRRTYPAIPKPLQRIIGVGFGSLKSLKDVTLNTLRFATGRLAPNPGIGVAVRTFYDALRTGDAPPIPAEEGRRMVALLEAVSREADDAKRTLIEAEKARPLAPSRILVTGAGGFLGSALACRLAEGGETVRVMLRRPSSAIGRHSNLDPTYGDLGDAEAVEKAIAGVEIVYHAGAAMKGRSEEFERGTVWGTRNVVEACLKQGVKRLVYVSSLSVLDHAGLPKDAVVTEQSSYEPHPKQRGLYTQAKLDAEQIVLGAVRDRGLNAVVLRPGQIFGPGTENVPPSGALNLAGGWNIIGNGKRPVPLVHVEDVVDALLSAAQRDEALGKIFTIVDPEKITQKEYADKARRAMGVKVRVIPKWLFRLLAFGVEMMGKALKREMPLTRYRVDSLRPLAYFDLTAAREMLGWTPRIGARQGLDRLYPARQP